MMMTSRVFARGFHSSRAAQKNVAVLGAAGGIGQPLSLLMKLSDNTTGLSLFDVVNTPGVAADIGHCNSPAGVSAAVGAANVKQALVGADVVIIPAGVPRKPGMTRDDLFNVNAGIVMDLAEACADTCPEAMICVISNPVNSTVPVFAETMKKHGVYNPKKLFGVTTLDVVRANTFVSAQQNMDVKTTNVTVIGGHAGTTILPLLSQVEGANFTDEEIAALTHRIQFGGDEVVQAKDGAGSATLSMAYAAYVFGDRLIQAMNGGKNIIECSFVENDLTDAPFFSTPITLGYSGIADIHSFGALSDVEQANFDSMIPDLIEQAEKGMKFVKNA